MQTPRVCLIRDIVARAASRGEIGPQPVPPHVLAARHALLRYELALRHHVPTDAELARIVDDITIPAIQPAQRAQRALRSAIGALVQSTRRRENRRARCAKAWSVRS